MGYFLYVRWLEVEPTTSVHPDDTQSNWATRPEALGFIQCSYSVPGPHPNIVFIRRVSGPFGCDSVSDFALDVLDSFEEYWSIILWDVPQLGFVLFVFPMIRLGLWIFWRKITEIKCHFHHIISGIHTCLPGWNSACQFLHPKDHPAFSPLFLLSFLKELTVHSPNLRSEVLYFTSLRMAYHWKFSAGEIWLFLLPAPSIYILNHLLVSVLTHGYLFYILCYNPYFIWCAFFAQ